MRSPSLHATRSTWGVGIQACAQRRSMNGTSAELPPRPDAAEPGVWLTHLGGRASALVPLALSAVVLFPVTRGCFRADDYLSLYEINNYTLFQYLIIPNAGHLYVVRNAVFYLVWLLVGTAQAPYLWSAFLTHLLNVWLLFRVIEIYTGSRPAAVFGATL